MRRMTLADWFIIVVLGIAVIAMLAWSHLTGEV